MIRSAAASDLRIHLSVIAALVPGWFGQKLVPFAKPIFTPSPGLDGSPNGYAALP
jgi:hypothetical protein